MAEAGREAVSVVVPFAGDTEEARATLLALQRIEFGPGDEAIVVDNSIDGVLASLEHPPLIRIVPGPEQPSSFYARNVGAEQAKNDWLLFLDADCLPGASLIDDYFADPISADVGAVAGAVLPAETPMGLVGRYKSFRRHLDQGKSTQAERPWAATANLLVRRAAWSDLGGFSERIRSGGDIDFSWRLFAVGWRLAYQRQAEIRHLHRDTLRAHAAQQIRYGGAHGWLRRRYPGLRMSRPLAVQLPLSAGGALRRAAVGDWEWSMFHLLDGVTSMLLSIGKIRGNGVRVRDSNPTASATAVADRWPDASSDDLRRAFAKAAEAHPSMRVEARHRPVRIARDALRELPSDYMEDDSTLDVLEGFAWLLAHRPAPTLRFLLRGGGGGVGVRALMHLAPAARRLANSGGLHVHALDPATAEEARALSVLLGATYTWGDGQPTGSMEGGRSQNDVPVQDTA